MAGTLGTRHRRRIGPGVTEKTPSPRYSGERAGVRGEAASDGRGEPHAVYRGPGPAPAAGDRRSLAIPAGQASRRQRLQEQTPAAGPAERDPPADRPATGRSSPEFVVDEQRMPAAKRLPVRVHRVGQIVSPASFPAEAACAATPLMVLISVPVLVCGRSLSVLGQPGRDFPGGSRCGDLSRPSKAVAAPDGLRRVLRVVGGLAGLTRQQSRTYADFASCSARRLPAIRPAGWPTTTWESLWRNAASWTRPASISASAWTSSRIMPRPTTTSAWRCSGWENWTTRSSMPSRPWHSIPTTPNAISTWGTHSPERASRRSYPSLPQGIGDQSAVRQSPHQPGHRLARTRATGRRGGAVPRRVLEIEPGHIGASQNLGVALYEQGQTREALQRWRDVLRRQPDQVTVLSRCGWILATDPDASVPTRPRR